MTFIQNINRVTQTGLTCLALSFLTACSSKKEASGPIVSPTAGGQMRIVDLTFKNMNVESGGPKLARPPGNGEQKK